MKSVLAVACLWSCCLAVGGDLSGRRAPSFALPDSRMNYHDILDYRGKVVLVDIMQTSCHHCQALSATLERLKTKYKEQLVVLSIVNPPDNAASVGQYITKFKVTSPVLFDCGQAAAVYLKVTPQKPGVSVPHLFVIDKQGMIREDFPYSDARKDIFEGNALVPILDKLIGAK